jgi:hypothetical protein
MGAAALSSTKFQRVANHSARCKLRVVFGQDHSGQGHIAPLVMREVGLFACVSHDVSCESTRLTVEGIRNNT